MLLTIGNHSVNSIRINVGLEIPIIDEVEKSKEFNSIYIEIFSV